MSSKIIDKIDLIVMDMAGTTVRDLSEVENCFAKACEAMEMNVTREWIKSV